MKFLFTPIEPIRRLAALLPLLFLLAGTAARAAVPFNAGGYKGQLWTDPPVIPVNKAQIFFSLKDDSGNPVENASVRVLAKMPGMDMGEKESVAKPVSGQAGTYLAPAVFAMAGGYEVTLQITGPRGATTAKVSVSTGQNTGGPTGGGGGPGLFPFLIGAGAVLFALFVVYKMRMSGQEIHLKGLLNRQVIGGLALVAVMLAVAVYAVNRYRRPGSMTPIEAQAMEMSTPAPPGTHAVELAIVERGNVRNAVRYTGTAVGYTEQNVYPRVTGWITWMPLYAGDRVRRGQVVARLDTSQVEPQVAERRAGVSMARQGVEVARTEHRQALAGVSEARADLAGKRDAVAEARANLTAAQEERRNADAELDAAETRVTDARAQLAAAEADREYWARQIERLSTLVSEGAVSREEFQRERAQAENAAAKVRQARAAIAQAQAEVRAKQAGIRKADAMVRAARTEIQQMLSEQRAGEAKVRTAQAAADAAQRRIGQSQAGVEQARASLGSAATARGYAEIRSQVDGVVTERVISPGVLVNPGQAILRISQVRPIRLQANVAEADMAKVEVGSSVTVLDRNGKRNPLNLKVTSVTPAVDPSSRTGIVEALYGNEDGRFVPGEFVEMRITTGQASDALRVPTRAVQTRSVPSGGILSSETARYVWVAESSSDGEYTVRPETVRTGLTDGERIEVVSGLKEGQRVVVAGAEVLREGDAVTAAGERIARDPAGRAAPADGNGMEGMGTDEGVGEKGASGASPGAGGVQAASVTLAEQGYQPDSLTLRRGVPARITFVRKTDATCGTEIVLPDYNVKKPLPLNRPVVVEFTPARAGEFKFTCGMDMLRGKVVVR